MDYEAGAGCEAPPGSGELKEPEGNFSVLHSLRVGREGLVMNFGVFLPRAALLPALALSGPLCAPMNINQNFPCSFSQAGGDQRSQIFTARRRRRGAFLLSQHLPSPCSSNISCVPRRRSIAGAGNAEAWEKTLILASCCLLFLSHVPRAAAEPAWSPLELLGYME